MPQLPSVSELLIGAHNPLLPGAKSESRLPQSYKPAPGAQKRSSETSPRQTDVLLHPSGASTKAGKAAAQLQNYHGVTHMAAETPAVHAHFNPLRESRGAASASSSGRNSISSVSSDPHAAPLGGSQMDYFSYRESHRPLHVSSHSQSSHSQSSSPQLQYRQRQGSSAGLVTRATSYQSIGSQDSKSPQGGSPTFSARPRPASFSYAPGPAPVGGPVSAFSPQVAQPVQFHGNAAVAGPAAPVAYFNGATAGSGYPVNHFPQGHLPGFPGQYAILPYNAQISPGAVQAYGHEYYPHAQFKAGPPHGGPYLQMEGMPAGHSLHAHPPQMAHGAGMEENGHFGADPNHALVNKRCIIKRRTRTGCLTCRKRRIKCDERKPHCFNCERSKKLCLGYEASSGNNSSNNNNNSAESNSSKEQSDSAGKAAIDAGVQPAKDRHRSSVHDLM